MKKPYEKPSIRTIESREIIGLLGPVSCLTSPGAGTPPGD